MALNRWAALLVLLLAGCSGDPGTGPVDVRWDRDACERCRMVLSDRQHSAQIRGGPAEKKPRVYGFDDIGCAVIWLDQQPWKDDPRTEIWVNDHRNGHWIDAREAWYVTGNETPMQYGLSAQTEPTPGALDYERAREHVYEVEAKYNIHGGNLDEYHATEPETEGTPK